MSPQETPLIIEKPEGHLYIVADSHLDLVQAPCSEFVEMLDALPEAQALVCLGDLFKVWLALPKFWTNTHREVMDAFRKQRDKGVEVVFIAGNREKLLPREGGVNLRDPFPFTRLSLSDWRMNWGSLRLAFIHGDTINSRDLQYLRWRAVSNSSPFEAVFRVMPGPMARWIAERLEALLSKTNRELRIEFPEDEVLRFAETHLQGLDHYFVGHFHLDLEIRIDNHPGSLRLVPDWLGTRRILRIDPQGRQAALHFSGGELTEVA